MIKPVRVIGTFVAWITWFVNAIEVYLGELIVVSLESGKKD